MRFINLLNVALVLVFISSSANASLIPFSSRTLFDNAAPGMLVEDFEEGNVSPGSAINFNDPLNNASNNAAFSSGDILAGLTIQTPFPNDVTADLILEGVGTAGNLSKMVYSTAPADTLDLIFDNANAVGFDVFVYSSPEIVDVSIYGMGNSLLGSFAVATDNTGVFFGVTSDMGLIERINISSRSNPTVGNGGWYEGVDNIAFGRVPEPTSTAFIVFGLAGIYFNQKRKLKRTH